MLPGPASRTEQASAAGPPASFGAIFVSLANARPIFNAAVLQVVDQKVICVPISTSRLAADVTRRGRVCSWGGTGWSLQKVRRHLNAPASAKYLTADWNKGPVVRLTGP